MLPTRPAPPASRRHQAGGGHHCGGCGRSAAQAVAGLPPRQRRAAWDVMVGDLGVTWLVASGRGFREERFCAGCAPLGANWTDLSCVVCADGPLLITGDHSALPGMPPDPAVIARAVAHLERRGWRARIGGAMVCPDCAIS